MIAGAGSGKTTYLVEEALRIKEGNILITTFTEVNEEEIRKKILKKNKYIPKNITVQTWFSFLLQHGVRPYQWAMHEELFNKKIGFYLFQGKSGRKYDSEGNPVSFNGNPIYWGEDNFFKFYFTKDLKIYSDKIAHFVFSSNKKTNNEIINRLSRIYSHIFIDEVQDLAGWDLELLKLFFKSSLNIVMVGDPRQGTYSTNDSAKHKKYRNGGIQDFIKEKCPRNICDIDSDTLNVSHRNNKIICHFSSKLYPELKQNEPCKCVECRNNITEHEGVFIIKPQDVETYCKKYSPVTKLHNSESEFPDLNFGKSKGLGFGRILIFPTDKISQYLKNGDLNAISTVKAKFYVAITRAKNSVGIVCDYSDGETFIENIEKFTV